VTCFTLSEPANNILKMVGRAPLVSIPHERVCATLQAFFQVKVQQVPVLFQNTSCLGKSENKRKHSYRVGNISSKMSDCEGVLFHVSECHFERVPVGFYSLSNMDSLHD
jgi:hypothetical protein